MILQPIILIPKLVLLAVIIVVLVILHGLLPPDQFKIAVIISVAAFLILSIVLWVVVLRALKNPHSRFARQTILQNESRSADGFHAGNDEDRGLLGKRGRTLSQLRPSGIARIGGERIAVVTEGTFIPPDTAIEVLAVEGPRIVVRPLPINEQTPE